MRAEIIGWLGIACMTVGFALVMLITANALGRSRGFSFPVLVRLVTVSIVFAISGACGLLIRGDGLDPEGGIAALLAVILLSFAVRCWDEMDHWTPRFRWRDRSRRKDPSSRSKWWLPMAAATAAIVTMI